MKSVVGGHTGSAAAPDSAISPEDRAGALHAPPPASRHPCGLELSVAGKKSDRSGGRKSDTSVVPVDRVGRSCHPGTQDLASSTSRWEAPVIVKRARLRFTQESFLPWRRSGSDVVPERVCIDNTRLTSSACVPMPCFRKICWTCQCTLPSFRSVAAAISRTV